MEIRVRETGVVMFGDQWRNYIHETTGKRLGELNEALINEYGADIVFEGPQATGGTVYQYSMRKGIEQQADGKWYTKYVLGPIFVDNEESSAAEQEALWKAIKDEEQSKRVREDRNKRLTDCDWTQLADSPVDKSVWATYRQALRDVPSQAGFPWNVQWPKV